MAGSLPYPNGGKTKMFPRAMTWFRHFLHALAFLLALFPSVMKMYETSHWYREGEPSVYDDAKDWFSNPNLPYQKAFQIDSILMRVYYFILPYFFSSLSLVVAKFIPTEGKTTRTKPRAELIVRSILRKTISFPNFMVKMGMPRCISMVELIGISAFFVVNWGTFVVRVRRSYPRGSRKLDFLVENGDAGKEPIDPFSWQACEIWAKTMGVLTIVNMAWYLIMPIGRRSVLLEALGLSWERAVKYHRWVGYYTVSLMAIHSFMYIAVFAHGDGHPVYDPEGVMLKHNLVPTGCRGEGECDEDQRYLLHVNMYGIVALILVMIMTVYALPWFRRNRFEWFYYTHHLFIPLILFTCLHYRGAILYLVPALAVYSVDKLMGILAYAKSGMAKTKMVSSDVLEVAVQLGKDAKYLAGQYVFLNVPDVSILEWHPFSLTSSPNYNSEKLLFHLKGVGTWTRDVIDVALKSSDGGLRIRLDGFYGHNVKANLEGKDASILVGGGIGITPMISLAMDLCKTGENPVTLLWVVKTIDEFKMFSHMLCRSMRKFNDRLAVKVWITLSRPEPQAGDEEDCKGIEKEVMADLDPEEQCDRIFELLQSNVECASSHDKEVSSSPTTFVFDRPGMSPAVNAFVMSLAIVMGLNGYALTSWIGNEHDIQPPDKLSLLHLTMVCASIFAVVGVVVLIRPLLMKLSQRQTPSHRKDETEPADGSSDSHETGSDVVAQSNSLGDKQLIRSMLYQHIGCRPNMESEFMEASSRIIQVGGKNASDIGVVACGPMAMIKLINLICNNPAMCFSWGSLKEDGTEAYFDFIEDDWEW